MHTAGQIVAFYEHFALAEPASHAYRDAHAADNLAWWHELTGDRTAYWAAGPHTVNGPQVRLVAADGGQIRFPSVGSHLCDRYGERYLSIGFMFDHGTVSLGGGQTAALPAPPEGWFEQPLGVSGLDRFVLDLRAPAPSAVHKWLDAEITTRGPGGPGSYSDGGSARQWFDVIVHSRQVTPATPP